MTRCLLCDGVCPECGGPVGDRAGSADWVLCSMCHATFSHGHRRGSVVFLNGPSSAGKSTIAKLIQSRHESHWFHTGIDHVLERMPLKFHTMTYDGDLPAADGLTWVLERDVQPPTLSALRVGETGLRAFDGMYRAVAGFAAAGNNVIVDDVIFDERVLIAAVNALTDVDVLFIGITCPVDVLDQRELDRGDRFRGLARAQHEVVHRHGVYDLELDTSELSADECAQAIIDRLTNGPTPDAFRRLRERFSATLRGT